TYSCNSYRIAVLKTNMLVFGSLYLLLYWMFPVCTQKIIGTFITQDDQSFPLDMATSSVDDRTNAKFTGDVHKVIREN
ncbi:hypothetical protein XENOCAPTIV_017143, partial [Xenoophorus captivus]